MASTSSNNASPVSKNNVCRYDVFLSFRGETRDKFTDHLYKAILDAGLIPFRDNDDIERGEDLKPEIERGIRESRASIVVLSKNYATSRWCLDELDFILKQRNTQNHYVLPIFYHVDPSHIRNLEKRFKIYVMPDTKWTKANVERWEKALQKVGNIPGEVPSGPETDFLKKVVGNLEGRLDLKEVYCKANVVGMDTWRVKIDGWFKNSSVQILAIWGMGGIGKTTLARHIVYSIREKFESISILEDIGSKSREQLHELQEKLLGDILKGKKGKTPSVWQGTSKIEKALKTEKALILLDNIVESCHLFDLLGTGTKTQCKIIITTCRENSPHEWFEHSTSWKCQELEMEKLDNKYSLELLCSHAFGSKAPTEGYDHLVQKALRYCDGNPLALEVLGSSFSSKDSKEFWESTLNSFEKELHNRIHSVLIGSYESLPFVSDRDLFLHIACFFVGKDKDYVVKILEPDYSALSGIETLSKRCLLSILPNKKLMMHRLLQEMARKIVDKESPNNPANRSRVWRDKESYDMLRKGKGSENIKGLSLDINLLNQGKEQDAYKLSNTESFKKMDKLKLLQLNRVDLNGPYENISEQLRWLCWINFSSPAIPTDLCMENLVAIDMSYSCLEEFEPPADLHSLKILNLRSSKDLRKIRNIHRLLYLEILILWDCISLTHASLEGLTCLTILNVTGCKELFRMEKISPLVNQEGSSLHSIKSTQHASFLLPQSLERLYLMDCNLGDTDYFPLTFKDQPLLIYLNLVNGLFESLPSYDYLKCLRVLDVSGCSDLKELLHLPSTLAELYIYYCYSLNIVTFESHRFPLQEFGYEGCVSLYEVKGLFKLMPVTMLEESDLKHMTWLREYEDLNVSLVGDAEITMGRSSCVQMLYEFNIMSTSLPYIKNSYTMTDTDYMYISQSTLLSFEVPICPEHRRLEGVIITFQYTAHGEDWVWFVKISTPSGVDLMYNPRVFGKPDEVGMWSSYWPIGNALKIEETVTVSIVVIKGLLDIHWCGANLVYTDEVGNEALQENKECVAILGEDFSEFQLSTGAYYLCRRDFFELMEAGKLTPDWFGILVDDKIDYTEVGGWRMTGKPEHPYQSYREVKTIRCIMYGPEMEEIYKIAELSKSSLVDITMESRSELSLAKPMDMVMASTSSSLYDKIEHSDSESDWSWLSLKGTVAPTTSSFFSDSESDFSRLSLQETMTQNIDSAPILAASNMFNSEVELSKFLGSIDILPDAYHATLKTSSTYELHTSPSGIPILAFNISPDFTKQFLNGEFDLVSSENHSLFSFISTKVNPSFSINKAAIDLYEQFILDLSKLEDQLRNKRLIITGQSLGGYLAILFTLRLQHAVDIEESSGSRKNKRPICITFGSPLLGDEALQRAIGERPTWKSSLLNVVTKTDPLACIFTSKTNYKPFGTFLCCTESGGHTAFENQEAILAVLDTMAALNAEKNKMHDYGNDLRSIRRKIHYSGALESGEPHLNSLRAGIILQFKEVGVLGDISYDFILRMEAKQVRRIRSNKNKYKTAKKLYDMELYLTYIEWYIKATRSKGGYYDSYKYPHTEQEIRSKEVIRKYKQILDMYWRKTVGEKELSPLVESANLHNNWLYGATHYRRIVEPLEIADHYNKHNTNYVRTRQDHYKLLEKWYNNDKGSYLREGSGNRASSLNVDSCFWAHVEEALISLEDLRKKGSSNNADDIEKGLEEFEAYLMNGIYNFAVSPDIFSDRSSLMKWWMEYKHYKGNSYNSEFAQYMNNGTYRSYQ